MITPPRSWSRTISTGLDKEQHMDQLDRITPLPEVMGGRACIRGARVTVGLVVGRMACLMIATLA